MPCVVVERATRESLLASASARWEAVTASRPDLSAAVALQRQLIKLLVELAGTLESGRLPRLSLPPRYVAAKLARGVPALTAEPIPVPGPATRPTLLRLCEALAKGGAGDAAERIREAIADGRIEATSLLSASLSRDQAAIRTGATHLGFSPDLLWLVAELAISPFACLLQQRVLAATSGGPSPADAALGPALDQWTHGYCAACGSWPALAELPAGRRVLRCSFCAFAWEPPDMRCVYCGERRDFSTTAPGGTTDRSIESCGACRGYLKRLAVPALSPFPLLAIGDLETMELDLFAMEHGWHRPALRST